MRRCLRLTSVVVCASAWLAAAPATAQQVAWEQWQHQVGIVDVGTGAGGSLVAMIAGRLFSISTTTGAASPFSAVPDGFTADPNAEPYFVVAQAQSVDNVV
jgi:hypothetical protein